MNSDALLYMAYDYGTATGRSASQVMELPVSEMLGYYAYLKVKDRLSDG